MSLADSLEAAADALPAAADSIRDANGDPNQLLSTLDGDAAVRLLSWLLANESDAAAELAESWAEDERGTANLMQIQDAELPKAGRKVLRRVLHRLRSQGIETPVAAPSTTRVARLPKVDDDLSAAYATALDPRGSRLVFLVEANPSGGARLFEGLLDDIGGIVDFQVYSAGRSRVRTFVKEATRRGGPQAVPIEPQQAQVLIQRAAAAHPSDRPLPRAFAEWKKHLAPPADALTPGEQYARDLGASEPTLAQQSRVAELLREGAIGPWPPDRDVLAKLAESLTPEADSGLVVSAATREARVETAKEQAAERLFDADHAARTASRFEETAYVFAKTGREEDARACLAVAGELRGDRPQACPAARAMAETLLAPLFESMLREAASEGEGEDAPLVES